MLLAMFRACMESLSCCSGDRRSLCDALVDETKSPSNKASSSDKAVDPSIQAVIEHAQHLLPGHKMSEWQLSWCAPETVQLYLEGRKGDVHAAAKILAEALQWREQHKEILSGSRVPVWQSDFRIVARAESGHPIIYLCYRHHVPPNVQLVLEHGAYVLEAAVHSMRGEARQFDIVIDCHGFNHTHLDPRPLAPLMKMIQQPYRERLRTAMFVGAPSAFSFVYRVGSRLVNENTRRKAMFASLDQAVAHVHRTAGGEAAQRLKDVFELNRQGEDCQPGEIEGRKLPSELDDAAVLFEGARRRLGTASEIGREGSEEVAEEEEELKAPSSSSSAARWCCRRRRVAKQGSTQASGFLKLKLIWHALG